MALSTSTSTLAVGASRTFNLSPGSALTLVAPPNVRATITETPNTVSASGVGGNASRVHNLQLGQTVTYGPYPMGGTVVVANASDSGTAITWVRSDAIVAESASGSVSLVSGAGNPLRPALSAYLKACIPGRDVATRFNDITGNGAHLLVEAGNTSAFNNNGYFTTTASTTGGLNIPQSKVLWNPYSESIVVSMVLKSAIPAGTVALMSIGANGGSGYQGFRLYQVVTTGYVGITGWANGGSNLAQSSTSAIAVSDATPQDRVVTVAYDAPTGSWYVWRDGLLILSAVGLTIGATGFANAVSNAELRLGASASIAGATVAVLQGRALQFAKYAGALPTNIGVIAARLAETPGVPISTWEW